MPEKSGMDAVLCVRGPTAGAVVCPQAGIAAAAITSKTKFRRLSMPTSPFRGLSTCRMLADCQTGDPSFRPVIDGIKVAIKGKRRARSTSVTGRHGSGQRDGRGRGE
jgi:hypothetical protein